MGKCRIGEIAPPLPAGLRDLGSISSAFSSRLSLYFHETYKSFAPNAPADMPEFRGLPSLYRTSTTS